MIKSRTIFVLLVIVLILVYLFLPWKGIFFLLALVLYLATMAYFSLNICSQAYIKTLCKSGTREKVIAITFDDGPDPDITPGLLNLLDQYQVKATFFCIGKHMDAQKGLVKEIDQRGHFIGNHTWSHHRWFDLFPSGKMKQEIGLAQKLIFDITGKNTKLFRPPYGITNPPLKRALEGFGHYIIGWGVRSFDTFGNMEYSLQRITKKVSPGDIVLFHDTLPISSELVKAFMEHIQKEGYKIVPLDKLLNIKAYE